MADETRQSLWLREHRRAWIDAKQLVASGTLRPEDRAVAQAAAQEMAIRVPPAMQAVIEAKAIHRQFVPTHDELLIDPRELKDPIGDGCKSPVAFLTHRYRDRALLHVTYQCAVYCRFCFRKTKVSQPAVSPRMEELAPALDYIAAHPEITEVILTGGDPLVLTDKQITPLLRAIDLIPHVKRIRLHTRVPVVLPSRVTEKWLHTLTSLSKPVWLVIHANHSDEFSPAAREALRALIESNIPLLSQSVLLRGVNDSVAALLDLFEAFAELKIKPYYLHYLDLAEGTSHFRVPLAVAIELYRSLRGRLSGYLIPQFMIDIPGGHGKVQADSHSVVQINQDAWKMQSPLNGQWIDVVYPSAEKDRS